MILCTVLYKNTSVLYNDSEIEYAKKWQNEDLNVSLTKYTSDNFYQNISRLKSESEMYLTKNKYMKIWLNA